jgi:hypothetical protein
MLIGQTDYTALVFIPDPASTDGSGKTGLVAANLTVSGTRVETDNDVVVTDYTSSLNNLAALTTAHTDWGLLEVSSTLAPGLYRLDIADAVFAAGAWTAVVYVMITTSAAAASPMEFNLVAYDSTNGVHLGLTGIPNAAAGASGGLLISGSNSGTTTLGALTVTGSMTVSDGLLVSRSTSNTSAITATGNGTGSGIVATSGAGATGDGIQATAGSTNGNGVVFTATGTGNALKAASVSGDAILTSVSTSGHGATFAGTGTTKHGINASGGSTTSHGINATGGGVGHGILATSGAGATGDGIKAVAASTNGNALNLAGVGSGSGVLSTGGATGHGAKLVGGATSGDGLNSTAPTSGIGINAAGAGTTKPGMLLTGGATTSAGLSLVGGGTSGDGLLVATTSGHGVNVSATGTDKHGATFTGGNGGTSDGVVMTAGTGGVGLRAAITGNITGNLSGTIGSLGATAKTDVNTEVLDVLNTDTFAEPGQEAPGATVSLVKKIGYLYKAFRNKSTQTATTYSLYNDDAATVDQKSAVSDDGTTLTRGEVATGP